MFRFIFDILTCVPADRISKNLDVFNSFHTKLQVTHEVLANGIFLFLDVFVIRNKHSIGLNWYKNPTWTGRMLNYKSHHPLAKKRAIIMNLVDTVFKISDEFYSLLKNISIFNDYPIEFVDAFLNQRLRFITIQFTMLRQPQYVDINWEK